jgi:hypothetical protein
MEMKNVVFLFMIILFGCISSPATKTEIIETDRKVTEKTFQYIPNNSDIDVRFEVTGNNLVGKLYLKEKVTYNVSKKEVKSFDYDKEGNFKNDFWTINLYSCMITLCLHMPFTIYEFYSAKSSLGEKRKFEETEENRNDFGEFNSDLFQGNIYSVILNEDNKMKVKNSTLIIPLDYFIKRKDEYFEYKIYYQEKEVVKSETIKFKDSKISGTSPKHKQLLAMIEREQKKREVEEEKEREQKEKMQSCDELKVGWESHYSNASSSDYLTICNFTCERTCKDSHNYGTTSFKKCRTDCKNNCKACFK